MKKAPETQGEYKPIKKKLPPQASYPMGKKRVTTRIKSTAARKAALEVDTLPFGTTVYSEILAADICAALTQGLTLRAVCSLEGMPHITIVNFWIHNPDEDKRPGFVAAYLEARRIGYHMMADDIINIADNSNHDRIKKYVDGKWVEFTDLEHIQRDKMRIDARRFIVSRRLPEYADSVNHNVNVNVSLSDRMAAARQRIKDGPTFTVAPDKDKV